VAVTCRSIPSGQGNDCNCCSMTSIRMTLTGRALAPALPRSKHPVRG
jgi:hypothetical protein